MTSMSEGNACWRLSLEFMKRYNARDWEWIENFYVEDVTFDDRRAGVGIGFVGRDKQLEHMRVIADIGSMQSRMTKIEERGDRLVVLRVDWETQMGDSDAYLTETLMVAEIDEQARCVGLSIFEVSDLAAAREDLEARYARQKVSKDEGS